MEFTSGTDTKSDIIIGDDMAKKDKKATKTSNGGKKPTIAIVVIVIILVGLLDRCGSSNNAGDNAGSSTSQQEQTATSNDEQTSSEETTSSDDATSEETTSDAATSANASEDASSFDPSATSYEGLTVEVTAPSAGAYKAIATIYGTSDADFAAMREYIIAAADYYGLAEDADTVGAEFDSIIGSEGGSGATWADGGIIMSAPNDVESWYKAELYVAK